jgi:hypothetical protein
MLRFGGISKAGRAGARSSEECVDGKILARRDQIAIRGRVFRFDLPLILREREPVQRAREGEAARPPFDHRFDVTLAISPQPRESATPATTRPQGLPLASADKRNGRPRLRPTVEAP